MASGQPYVSSYGDAFLFATLRPDPFLGRYCPGGVLSNKPPEGSVSTLVRFWLQSSGTDKARQDGRQGRVLSVPTYVVTVLDRQTTGSDKVYGTIGSKLDPPQPYLQLAQTRIYDLLHGGVFAGELNTYAVECFSEYCVVEDTPEGLRDVQVGWWARVNAL